MEANGGRRAPLELAVVVAAAVGVYFALVPLVSGPVSWDELLYLDLAIHPEPRGEVVNRFFHIYLQRVFFLLAGDALVAARWCWTFLFVTTLATTYCAARRLSGSASPLFGLVACAVLVGQTSIIEYAGVTYADFTVMALVSIGMLLFLLWRSTSSRHGEWLLVGLGTTLFLVLRTKETGVCLWLLAVAIAVDGGWSVKTGVRLARLALGLGVGAALMMLCHQLWLGDALFDYRPDNFRRLLAFNLGAFQRDKYNWFGAIAHGPLLVPFALYLASGMAARRPRTRADTCCWLIPIALLAILTVLNVQGHWGVITRYYWPAYPVLAVWASHCLWQSRAPHGTGSLPASHQGRREYWQQWLRLPWRAKVDAWSGADGLLLAGAAVIGAAVVALVFGLWFDTLRGLGWNTKNFYTAVLSPLCGCAAIGLLSPIVRSRPLRLFGLSLVLAVALLYSACYGWLESRRSVAASRARFAPLAAFRGDIAVRPDNTFALSPLIYAKTSCLGRNPESMCWMVNVFYNSSLPPRNFTDASDLSDVATGRPNYVLLHADESEQARRHVGLVDPYEWIRHPNSPVLLLRRREM